jgi:hypothetical protein
MLMTCPKIIVFISVSLKKLEIGTKKKLLNKRLKPSPRKLLIRLIKTIN